ncbi:ABC transporter ATP-binding protein [Labrys neptuniae]
MKADHTPTLVVRGLHAGYGGHDIIADLTLPPLQPGRLVALVGPNSAGKSTLLRAMAHLIRMRGEVALGERDLTRISPAARARLVGFMPQALPLDVSLSVLETVIATLRVAQAGEGAGSHAEQALDVLTRLGVPYLASLPLDRLSGGQKQVASLAQAIACAPPVLLLDEPTSALDLSRQYFIMRSIKDYAAGGRIVVAVLHDLALAAQWADDLIVMRQGKLHGAGPPDEILTPRMLADVYDVEARVEHCSQGRLQIMVDGVVERSSRSDIPPTHQHQKANP